MDIAYSSKQLVTVEYPGTVINMEKFVKSFGGEKEMFSAFRDSSKRLELKFRPDDPYCKSAHGDRFNTTNLLMKVIKRTKKKKDSSFLEKSSDQDVKYKVEFLGIVSNSYKFKAMADFQIPPIKYDETKNQHISLIPDLVPTSLHPPSWLDKNIDLFVPPLIFSRFDLPQNGYVDMLSKNLRKEVVRSLPPNIIGQSRQRRAGFAVFTTFESTNSNNAPQTEALLQLRNYPLEVELKKKIDSLFEDRPIWSRNALLGRLKLERNRIKHALPCSGYYFTNGPWRALWVKFGYNPRKDPAAKVYQIMDLRINPSIPINDHKNKRRQTYYALPNKSTQNQQRVATINTDYLISINKDEKNNEEMDEEKFKLLTYEYFPGELPTNRQSFYQLCDIHLESVQQLIHQNDGQEDFCHEKDGWCIPGTLERCRELLIADILKSSKMSREIES